MGMDMKVVVCVKQVPDMRLPFEVDFETNSVVFRDPVYVVNPWDRVAVEEALRIKEKLGGEVTVITAGPPKAEEALRCCLAMGADQAIHLCDNAFNDSDAYVKSQVLARVIDTVEYDLILCGRQSWDSARRQVGASIAELLDLPLVSDLIKLEISPDCRKAIVHKRLERGDRQVIECWLPALFTVAMGLNEPRYPSIRRRRSAKRRSILRFDLESLKLPRGEVGHGDVNTRIISVRPLRPRPQMIFTPDSDLPAAERMKLILSGGVEERGGESLEGSVRGLARKVVQFLAEDGIVSRDGRP
jgi:electron transfer flavoprotein beta subunit